jgi:hypothetical protein
VPSVTHWNTLFASICEQGTHSSIEHIWQHRLSAIRNMRKCSKNVLNSPVQCGGWRVAVSQGLSYWCVPATFDNNKCLISYFIAESLGHLLRGRIILYCVKFDGCSLMHARKYQWCYKFSVHLKSDSSLCLCPFCHEVGLEIYTCSACCLVRSVR